MKLIITLGVCLFAVTVHANNRRPAAACPNPDYQVREFLDAGFFNQEPAIYFYRYCVPKFSRAENNQYKERVQKRKVAFKWDKRFGDNVIYDLNRIKGWIEVRDTDKSKRLKYHVFVDKGAIRKVVRAKGRRI